VVYNKYVMIIHKKTVRARNNQLTSLRNDPPHKVFGVADVLASGAHGAALPPGVHRVREGDDVEVVALPQVSQDGGHGLLRLAHTTHFFHHHHHKQISVSVFSSPTKNELYSKHDDGEELNPKQCDKNVPFSLYLFDLGADHGATDVDDKYDVLGNHREPPRCEIMHKVAVVHLGKTERGKEER